jgi:hypothetical protein
MRFGDDVLEVGAASVARVAPRTPRSHRTEGDEPVEMWAISRRLDQQDAVKIDDFWEASPHAAQGARPVHGDGRGLRRRGRGLRIAAPPGGPTCRCERSRRLSDGGHQLTDGDGEAGQQR